MSRPRRAEPAPEGLAAPAPSPTAPWPALVVGGAVMGFAIVGAWRDLGDRFGGWALWIVGADLVHDALVAPVACLLGALVTRVVPAGRARAHVQAGLVATAMVSAVVWIPLRGLGGNPGNPTIRPLDYATATLTALVLVWAVVIVSLAVSVAVARGRRRGPTPGVTSGRTAP